MNRLFSILRLRFGLRLLLIAFGAISIWLAVFASRWRSHERAVEQVRDLGGHLIFDHFTDNDYWLADNRGWARRAAVPAPTWLIELIDTGSMSSLRYLDFWGEPIVDDDLAVVRRFDHLKHLGLREHPITDEGLRHVSCLNELEYLYLGRTNILGHGLRHILDLNKLRRLMLEFSPLTDDGMKYIGQLTTLEELGLAFTQITDDGLQYVSSLRNLTKLSLCNTSVTDQGLRHLVDLNSLAFVDVSSTGVTNAGRAWLRTHHPNCEIKDCRVNYETEQSDAAEP